MGVRMSEGEAWEYLARGHTGIVTTLRRDGMPVPLPVWYVADGESIMFSTPARSKKVTRLRRDSRASFLVEAGERWRELTAVLAFGTCSFVEDADELDEVRRAIDQKYAAFRTASAAMPKATRTHYGSSTAVVRLVPTERLVTWDNRKLRLEESPT